MRFTLSITESRMSAHSWFHMRVRRLVAGVQGALLVVGVATSSILSTETSIFGLF